MCPSVRVEASEEGCYQHAKAVIIDAGMPKAKALVTITNLSETVQRHNDGADCLIMAPWQANRVAQHFHALAHQRYFIRLDDE